MRDWNWKRVSVNFSRIMWMKKKGEIFLNFYHILFHFSPSRNSSSNPKSKQNLRKLLVMIIQESCNQQSRLSAITKCHNAKPLILCWLWILYFSNYCLRQFTGFLFHLAFFTYNANDSEFIYSKQHQWPIYW